MKHAAEALGLQITVGPEKRPWKVFPDDDAPFAVRIGRGSQCELILGEDLKDAVRRTVSKVHARLFRRDGQLWVEDLNSHNFTFLNNRVIFAPTALELPCNLRLGSVTLNLEHGPMPPPAKRSTKKPRVEHGDSGTHIIDPDPISVHYSEEHWNAIRNQLHWADAFLDIAEQAGRARRAEELQERMRAALVRSLQVREVRVALEIPVDALEKVLTRAGVTASEVSGAVKKWLSETQKLELLRVKAKSGKRIIWLVRERLENDAMCSVVVADLENADSSRCESAEADSVVTLAVFLTRPYLATLRELEQRRATTPDVVPREPSPAMMHAAEAAGLWGEAPGFRKSLYMAEMAATRFLDSMDTAVRLSTVFLHGESGSGKSRFAELIHSMSKRGSRPFYGINCAAVPVTLAESELFGFEKGAHDKAFTSKPGLFELCKDGTLFLDEIGKTSLDFQSKLLKILDTGTYMRLGGTQTLQTNCQVILATSEEPAKLCEEKLMLQEFWYRVGAFTITIPPLRDRHEDIPLLIQKKLQDLNEGAPPPRQHKMPLALERLLSAYPWPGNLRELMQCLEVAHAMTPLGAPEIDAEAIPEFIRKSFGIKMQTAPDSFAPDLNQPLGDQIAAFERLYFAMMIKETEGNLSEVARRSGKSYPTVLTKVRQLRSWANAAPEAELGAVQQAAGDFWHVIIGSDGIGEEFHLAS